jgi:hypothetical protein
MAGVFVWDPESRGGENLEVRSHKPGGRVASLAGKRKEKVTANERTSEEGDNRGRQEGRRERKRLEGER